MSAETNERPVVNIIGERVALGPMRKDLAPLYHRWANDLRLGRDAEMGPVIPTRLDSLEEGFSNSSDSERNARFTIYELGEWRPIGDAGLSRIDHYNRTALFGIAIGEAEYRGRGYGTEATRLVLDYAFNALGLHSVMLGVFEWNVAAIRVYLKVGFKEIGRQRQSKYMGGRFWDAILMDCLAAEFESPVLERSLAPDAQSPNRLRSPEDR